MPVRYKANANQSSVWRLLQRGAACAVLLFAIVPGVSAEPFIGKDATGSLLAAAGLILLIVVNAFLFLNYSRRRQAEEALREQHEHLEELVRQRSAELETANSHLRLDILERERTERALRKAEASFRDIFENAAEGIYQSTPQGKLLTVNPTLARMAGYESPAAMIRGMNDFRTDFFVDPMSRLQFEEALRRSGEVQGFETCVFRRGRSIIRVLENARTARDETGSIMYYEGMLQDITERHRALEALRESQQLLNRTFDSLRDAILIVNAETRAIVDCNHSMTELFGYGRADVVGQSIRLLHSDEAAFEKFQQVLARAFLQRGYLELFTFQMRRKNGEVFITQHTVVPLDVQDNVVMSYVSVIRDITEQKRTEAKLEHNRRKLRALAAELTIVEARERRAIAAQLHENLGQLLATTKMKIAGLRNMAIDSGLGTAVSEVQALVEEALQHTRSLTYQLSPPILYQLGTEAALKWLGENMQKQYGFQVCFSRQGESGRLGEESSVFLFSAVRELLVNVAKHGHAGSVEIRLRWMEDCVDVLVRDNGNGFAKTSGGGIPDSQDGFGLFNIHERVSDLGGHMRVRSAPGKGTAIKIQLPLASAAREAIS